MSDNAMFAFKSAPTKARCVVQEDALDDSTKCEACGNAEMLGYVCDMCEHMLCGKCLKYEAHACAPWAETRAREYAEARMSQPSNAPSFKSCYFSECRDKCLIPIVCPSCKNNFCTRHKLENDHDCRAAQSFVRPAVPATAKKSAKANPFAALFLPASLTKAEEPKTVMAPDVHVDDRYPITVMFPHEYHHSGPKRVVVHKRWGLGKTVDFLLTSFGNKTGETRHVLVHASTLTKLPTISSFQELNATRKLAKTDLLLLLPDAWFTKAIAQFNAERMSAYGKENLWKQFYRVLPDLVQ
ncbi:hypothetical protein DIPPA_01514 [Diplonema papillatum]|nr:hypothetical protein DIPPA_01514 [Diplonema papillatum]